MDWFKSFDPLVGLAVFGFLDGFIPVGGALDYGVLLLGANGEGTMELVMIAVVIAMANTLGNVVLFCSARFTSSKLLAAGGGGGESRYRQWYERYGFWSVAFVALVPFIPFPMKLFTSLSGAFSRSLSPVHFGLLFFPVRVVRYAFFVGLGHVFGSEALRRLQPSPSSLMAAFLVFASALLVFRHLKTRWQRQQARQESHLHIV